jgi:hypothetical protein
MTFVTQRPQAAVTTRRPRWAAVGAAVLAWPAAAPVLWAVLADSGSGLDMMDESHYLMAAQPWASDKAFNGPFGWYTGLLWRLTGADLGRFRFASSLLLVAAAVVLAVALRRAAEVFTGITWSLPARWVWPAPVAAVALCYDTVYVRTPSYNWCASIGEMLLAAGLVTAVAEADRGRSRVVKAGVLVAVGLFVTAVGKATTAVAAASVSLVAVLLLVAFGGRALRLGLARAMGVAAGAGAVLMALHVVFVHDLAFTVATYRRVTQTMSLVDPYHYAGTAVPDTVVAGLRNVVLERPWGYLPWLLLPAAAVVLPWARVPRPGRWLVGAAGLAMVVPTVSMLREYPGGVPGLGMSASAPVVVALAGVVVALVATVWRAPPAGRALVLAVALFGIGIAYPIGTNVEYATQLPGGYVVLFAAAVAGVCALPKPGALGLVGLLAVIGLALGDVLVPLTRANAPYRIALFAEQTVPRTVVAGSAPVLVDTATAAWIDGLRDGAASGGWRPGTPMLDLTWHPASVLVLDGRAPRVLLPDFPGWPEPGVSAAFAMAQEDPAVWRHAWLLIPEGQDDAIADQATAVVGRRFPGDFVKMTSVVAPYDGQAQGLWRPAR